jgi:hypothetical protein
MSSEVWSDMCKSWRELNTLYLIIFFHAFGLGSVVVAVPSLCLDLYNDDEGNAQLFYGGLNGIHSIHGRFAPCPCLIPCASVAGAAFLQIFSNSFYGWVNM